MFKILIFVLLIHHKVTGRDNNDEFVILPNMSLSEIDGSLIECMNICINSVKTLGISECYNKCHQMDSSPIMSRSTPGGQFSFSVDLICNTDTLFGVQISAPNMTKDFGSPGLFAVEIKSNSQSSIYISASSQINLADLQPLTEYLISGIVISRSNRIEMIAERNLSTLPDNWKPESVVNISTSAFYAKGDLLAVDVHWKVPTTAGCDYEALWHEVTDNEMPEQIDIDITSGNVTQTTTIDRLELGSRYKLAIRGVAEKTHTPFYWMDIDTPSCLEWTGYDLEQCAPPPPEKLDITEVLFLPTAHHYDIQVK